jgi:hypothetical protein
MERVGFSECFGIYHYIADVVLAAHAAAKLRCVHFYVLIGHSTKKERSHVECTQ